MSKRASIELSLGGDFPSPPENGALLRFANLRDGSTVARASCGDGFFFGGRVGSVDGGDFFGEFFDPAPGRGSTPGSALLGGEGRIWLGWSFIPGPSFVN